ncbi:hypothetical protein [Salibacterium halotolerans]|uniref:Transmembrane secretion effector n=1 Tax=Salibacterium halotolerans TaxID=1884432 RepID=A0A1I5RF34_9BACI|nr:hypothetical protein [Salibacterium halotolerans]SFP56921.1 hypothetical protein SAMN05518683_10717 [Salibacterium halotolerans]
MQKKVHIFIEYKITAGKEQRYRQVMKEIVEALAAFGASSFQWFEAVDQDRLYVEMFELESLSVYHTVKEARRSKNHPVFNKLDECLEGGLDHLHCWGFESKNDELEEKSGGT